MAEKISIQIALEGGKEIAAQLAEIGEAGKAAFADISKSAEQVGGFKNLKPEEVTSKLKTLGLEGTAAFDKIKTAVESAARFESLVQGVQSVETALAALGRAAGPVGAAIAAAFVAASKATIAFSEELGKISDQAVKVGLSFEQFKTLREELAKVGVSGAGAASGLANFQKQLGEPHVDVIDVLTQAGNVFRFVGDTSNLAANNIQPFIAQLRTMPDTVERTNLALKQLGDAAGTEVIQGLRRAEGSMSGAEAKAYDLQQAIKQLKEAWDQLGSVALAPALTQQINTLTSGIQTLSNLVNNFSWSGLAEAGVNALLALNSALNPTPQFIRDIASSLAGIAWDAISGAGVAAWNALTSAVQSAGSAISSFISSIAGITWDAISGAGVAAWNAITAAIQSAIAAALSFIGLKPSAPATGGGAGGMASGGLIGGRGSGTSDSNLAWLSRGEHIMPARVVAQPGVLSLLEALRRGGGIPGFAAGGVAGGATGLWSFLNQVTDQLDAALRALNPALMSSVMGIAKQVETAMHALLGLMNDLPRNAAGGLLGGRGTGTSDSNLAWVSRGEYITPARAVAQPGVLAFLEALRRSGGNLSAVLDGMGRFALGGLMLRPAMAFAAGGPVGGGNHVTIQFPGVPPVGGLRASSAVVEELQRVAALAQVRSGGRKPSRYS